MIKSIAILALLSITGCAGSYMNSVEIYGGLSSSAMRSPYCMRNGTGDTHISGQLGVTLNAWESVRRNYRIDVGYDHDSCVFADDWTQSDAKSIRLTKVLWRKKGRPQ